MTALQGSRYGMLTVLEISHVMGFNAFVATRCDCGAHKTFRLDHLRSGKRKRCSKGCRS